MVSMVKYVVVAIMQDNGWVIVGDAVDAVVLVELRIEKGFLVCISSRELAFGSGNRRSMSDSLLLSEIIPFLSGCSEFHYRLGCP